MTLPAELYLQAVHACRFCPMCHDVDEVTTVERRETTSPRGRGLALFAAERDFLPLSAELANVIYQFPADGMSREICAGHIPHDDMVIEARRRLAAAGWAPASAREVLANFNATGSPFPSQDSSNPSLAALAGESKKGAPVLLYFGSAARCRRTAVVRSLASLLRGAGVEFQVLADERDTGLLLYQLGYHNEARAAAARLEAGLRHSGATTLVTPDADAFRALATGFGDLAGISKPRRVVHASEFLRELQQAGRLSMHPSGDEVYYHDPCALGRFAPCADAPRELIHSATGKSPLESGWNRRRTRCSGECGGLPFTFPQTAAAIARRRVEEAVRAGARCLVTSGAAAASLLESVAPAGLRIAEISEFVFSHMNHPAPKAP
jgi:Fe-S oxidoreductase